MNSKQSQSTNADALHQQQSVLPPQRHHCSNQINNQNNIQSVDHSTATECRFHNPEDLFVQDTEDYQGQGNKAVDEVKVFVVGGKDSFKKASPPPPPLNTNNNNSIAATTAAAAAATTSPSAAATYPLKKSSVRRSSLKQQPPPPQVPQQRRRRSSQQQSQQQQQQQQLPQKQRQRQEQRRASQPDQQHDPLDQDQQILSARKSQSFHYTTTYSSKTATNNYSNRSSSFYNATTTSSGSNNKPSARSTSIGRRRHSERPFSQKETTSTNCTDSSPSSVIDVDFNLSTWAVAPPLLPPEYLKSRRLSSPSSAADNNNNTFKESSKTQSANTNTVSSTTATSTAKEESDRAAAIIAEISKSIASSSSSSTPNSKSDTHNNSKSKSKSNTTNNQNSEKTSTINNNNTSTNNSSKMPSISISGVGFRRSSRRESVQTEGDNSHCPSHSGGGRSRSRYSRHRVSPNAPPPLTEEGSMNDSGDSGLMEKPGHHNNNISTKNPSTSSNTTGGTSSSTATFNSYKFSDPACPFDSNGCCVIHPDVRMAKHKGSRGWKIYLEECPRCFDCSHAGGGNNGKVGGSEHSGAAVDTESMTSDPTQDSIHTRDYSEVNSANDDSHYQQQQQQQHSQQHHHRAPPPSQPVRISSNSSVASGRSSRSNHEDHHQYQQQRRPRDHEADRKSLMELRSSSGNGSVTGGSMHAYDRIRQDSYRGRSPEEHAIDENASSGGGGGGGRMNHHDRDRNGGNTDRTRSISRRPNSRRSVTGDLNASFTSRGGGGGGEKPRDRSRPRERDARDRSRPRERSLSRPRERSVSRHASHRGRSDRSPSRGPSKRSSSRHSTRDGGRDRGDKGERRRRSRRVPKPKTPRTVCVDGIPFDSKGRCNLHPHIKLASKKMLGGWKIHLEFCPACAKEGEMMDNETDYDDRSMVSEVSDATGFTQGSRGGGSVYSRRSNASGYHRGDASVYSTRSNYSNASGVSWSSKQKRKKVGKNDDVPLDAEGYCLHHPEVQMAKLSKKGEWKVLLDFCPECAEDSLMLGGAVGGGGVSSSFRSSTSSRKESSFRSSKGESSSQDSTFVEKMPFVDEDGKPGHYTGHVNADGKPTGKGKMKYVDGSKFSGIWEDGSKIDGRVTSAKKAAASSSRREHGPTSSHALPSSRARAKSKSRHIEVKDEDQGVAPPTYGSRRQSRREESVMSRGDYGSRRKSHRTVDDMKRSARSRSRAPRVPISQVGECF